MLLCKVAKFVNKNIKKASKCALLGALTQAFPLSEFPLYDSMHALKIWQGPDHMRQITGYLLYAYCEALEQIFRIPFAYHPFYQSTDRFAIAVDI